MNTAEEYWEMVDQSEREIAERENTKEIIAGRIAYIRKNHPNYKPVTLKQFREAIDTCEFILTEWAKDPEVFLAITSTSLYLIVEQAKRLKLQHELPFTLIRSKRGARRFPGKVANGSIPS
jgi:hypothetical protein